MTGLQDFSKATFWFLALCPSRAYLSQLTWWYEGTSFPVTAVSFFFSRDKLFLILKHNSISKAHIAALLKWAKHLRLFHEYLLYSANQSGQMLADKATVRIILLFIFSWSYFWEWCIQACWPQRQKHHSCPANWQTCGTFGDFSRQLGMAAVHHFKAAFPGTSFMSHLKCSPVSVSLNWDDDDLKWKYVMKKDTVRHRVFKYIQKLRKYLEVIFSEFPSQVDKIANAELQSITPLIAYLLVCISEIIWTLWIFEMTPLINNV